MQDRIIITANATEECGTIGLWTTQECRQDYAIYHSQEHECIQNGIRAPSTPRVCLSTISFSLDQSMTFFSAFDLTLNTLEQTTLSDQMFYIFVLQLPSALVEMVSIFSRKQILGKSMMPGVVMGS